jgi:hypothetical protein
MVMGKKNRNRKSPRLKTYQVASSKNFGLPDAVWSNICAEAYRLNLQIVDIAGASADTLPIVLEALHILRQKFNNFGDGVGMDVFFVDERTTGYVVVTDRC